MDTRSTFLPKHMSCTARRSCKCHTSDDNARRGIGAQNQNRAGRMVRTPDYYDTRWQGSQDLGGKAVARLSISVQGPRSLAGKGRQYCQPTELRIPYPSYSIGEAASSFNKAVGRLESFERNRGRSLDVSASQR